MTIPFTCPHCGHFTEAELQFAGQTGPCGNCGQQITLPAAEPATQATASAASHPRRRMRGFALSAAGVIVALALLAVIIRQGLSRQTAAVIAPSADMTCSENLEQIGQALWAFHDQHRQFPAAVSNNENGRSGFSWRAALLPQLGEKKLFDQIHWNDDWDSSNNSHVGPGRPNVYAAADDDSLTDVETSYLAVVGEHFAFHPARPRSKDEFIDGLESTIVVIEARGWGITWLEPKELDATRFEWLMNNRVAGVGSHHADGGVHVLMANGDAYWLDDATPPEVLRALATIDGGETVNLQRWLKP